MLLTSTAFADIVPPNNLYISTTEKNISTIDEVEFNKIIDEVGILYQEEVAKRGGVLTMQKDWEKGTVNAYAMRGGNRGEKWIVAMYGGLARHPLTTADGFSLVVCHELGHHLGGAPKKRMPFANDPKWGSNEGQSDYFSTSKCLRKLFETKDNEAYLANKTVPQYLINQCAQSFTNHSEQLVCQRTALAGFETAKLLRDIKQETTKKELSFETPSKKKVLMTSNKHPESQCRLDTYLQGALCTVSADEHMSNDDLYVGACTKKSGHTTGARPRCWMKSH